jgi:hypothetical protein
MVQLDHIFEGLKEEVFANKLITTLRRGLGACSAARH